MTDSVKSAIIESSLKQQNKIRDSTDEIQKKKTKKSFHVRADFQTSDLSYLQKEKETNILRNANNTTMKTLSMEGKQISLKNTCAFDSIAQVLMRATMNPSVGEFLDSSESQMAKFFKAIKNKGMNCEVVKNSLENLFMYMKILIGTFIFFRYCFKYICKPRQSIGRNAS